MNVLPLLEATVGFTPLLSQQQRSHAWDRCETGMINSVTHATIMADAILSKQQVVL